MLVLIDNAVPSRGPEPQDPEAKPQRSDLDMEGKVTATPVTCPSETDIHEQSSGTITAKHA